MNGFDIPFIGLQRQYQQLKTEILDTVDSVLSSGHLMSGEHTAKFEHWLAEKNQVQYAITCHSGTQALEILAAYSFQESVEQYFNPTVLVPAFSFPATASAFAKTGWDLYFIDVDSDGCLDVAKIPEEVDYHTVVLVGLYGTSVLEKYVHQSAWTQWMFDQVNIVEDAAQHWLSDDCTRIANSAVSFDPTKNLANHGNGGAVLTNDSQLAEFARAWATHGKPKHNMPCSNSRMSELDCATLMIKTHHIDRWQQRRLQIADYWQKHFADLPVRCLINESNRDTHACQKFVIETDHRNQIKQRLEQAGIETKIHYERPLHEIEAFSSFANPGYLTCASSLARRVLSLPIYPELTDAEVEYIKNQVVDCVSAVHS